MKTRIVYPQMWLDEKFVATKKETKVLFNYLINNPILGLTRYLHITDRQMMFDTSLTQDELAIAQHELTELKWCFFTDNWVFQNHKCAYVDYIGRDRVMEAKAKELAAIPQKVRDYFNPLITCYEGVNNVDNVPMVNPLITGYKPVLNPKPEIINDKPETLNPQKESKGFLSARDIAERLRVHVPKNGDDQKK